MSDYIIATTPRSGSYLLCDYLSSTGVAGSPSEPFCSHYEPEYRARWGLPVQGSFSQYLEEVRHRGTSGNGVFGTKVHWHELDWLSESVPANVASTRVLDVLFPRYSYILLTREDLRGQAISYYRASKSNRWWVIPGVENRQVTGEDPPFCAETIRRIEKKLAEQQATWENWLNLSERKVHRITYERLVADPAVEIGKILGFLGISGRSQSIASDLARQADHITDKWRFWLDRMETANPVL